MHLLRTLYVNDHRARVRISKRNIVVDRPEQRTRIPIETLEAVILTGHADITNDALGELTHRGIRVAALSRTGRLRFATRSPVTGNVHLRLAHYRTATDDHQRLKMARWIVAGKLQNQRRRLKRWAQDNSSAIDQRRINDAADTIGDRIAALHTFHDLNTLRGIEGDAARRYFKSFAIHLSADPAFSFQRRSRRPPQDPLNAALSYTYGLVLTETLGAADAVGLDPQIGFLHNDTRPGRPSLALDLLEELRPALADRLVIRLVRHHQLRAEHFQTTAGTATYLTDTGRRTLLGHYDDNRNRIIKHPLLNQDIPIARLPTIQATLMARYLRGDLPAYPPYVSSN